MRRSPTMPILRRSAPGAWPAPHRGTDDIFSTDTTAAWLARLQGRIPASPVYDLPQALDNPFVRQIGMLRDLPHPQHPDYRVLANPIKFDGERLPSRVGPMLGEQTDEVLRGVGYSDAQIAALKSVGSPDEARRVRCSTWVVSTGAAPRS
jgi:crotonobetainyl-CoA:carnitine CoA-transferase CaiB-like acyl-CoA transferase